MFLHAFKHTFKSLLRQRQLVFWALVFPIILSLLFKLALGNVDKAEQFEKVPIAVDQKLMEDDFFKMFLDQLVKEDYLEIVEGDGKTLLEEEKVVAHIVDKDQLKTKTTGIKQTFVEYLVNSYIQSESTIKNILSKNPMAAKDIEKLLKIDDYIEDQSNPNMGMVNTYFYTLVGMQAMYGYIWGMEVLYQYEANLSTAAKRNLMAPIKKSVSLTASLLVAWIINCIVVLLTMAFCKFALGVNFGDRWGYIILLVINAALTGVAFGAFMAVSNKKDKEFKLGIGISLTMLLSFLAGMMMAQMKIIVQRNAPIINKINPVALITDAIYSLYYYEGIDRFMTNIYCLLGVTAVLLILVWFMVRGKKYESL